MVFGTAFIYEAAIKMVEMAEMLGHDDDATHYRDLANKIRKAYIETMYDSKRYGVYDPREPEVYQQSTNVIALAFDLVPEEDRQKVFDALAHDVRETWDGHVSIGAVGVKFILRMLTEGGYGDLAYEAATTPTYPGWGWWFQSLDGLWTGTERIIVDTHWEAWRYFMSSSVIDSSRSHNHAFRGVIDDWLYEDIAGIEALAPMYRKIEVKPTLVGDLTDAGACFETPLGTVSAAWEITGAFLTQQVHVPVGATATVYVPVPEAGVEVSDHGGAVFVEYHSDGTGDYAVYEAGSGDYIFWTPYDQD
jgi:alpha-L-rhamnosidase